MPTYDYRCPNGHTFELFHGIKDDTPKHCPECGEVAERVPSSGAGLLFKGSGFYITDYRSKNYRDKAKQEGGSGAKSDTGSKGSTEGKSSSEGKGSSEGKRSSEGKSSGGSSSGGSGSSGSGSGGN